jgi:hypothetical protein
MFKMVAIWALFYLPAAIVLWDCTYLEALCSFYSVRMEHIYLSTWQLLVHTYERFTSYLWVSLFTLFGPISVTQLNISIFQMLFLLFSLIGSDLGEVVFVSYVILCTSYILYYTYSSFFFMLAMNRWIHGMFLVLIVIKYFPWKYRG